MLLRIRTNVGTWKYTIEPSKTISDVVQRIQCPKEAPSEKRWIVSSFPSRDPGGNDLLDQSQTLQALGIGHGAMIYCRVKDPDEELQQNPEVEVSGSSLGSATMSDLETKVAGGVKSATENTKIEGAMTTSSKRPRISTSSSVAKRGKSSMQSKLAPLVHQSHPAKFQIASYNVWFGPPDASVKQVYPKERMSAISKELQSCGGCDDLLFIGFQELTESLRCLLEPQLKDMNYKFCTQPLGGSYGVGLAISRHVDMVETKFLPFLDSTQGRGLLYVQTPTILFGTTHLESFVDAKHYTGVQEREAQMVQAATFCQERLEEYPSLEMAMIAGDFNWDDERTRKGTAPNTPLLQLLHDHGCGDWTDSGTPFDYTYDCKENVMLGGNLRRRFDRCVYLQKPSSKSFKTTLSKLGMAAIPHLTWAKKNPFNGTTRTVPVAPSDHFGIAVKFTQI